MIKWNKKARFLFKENIRYAKLEFGQSTALRWIEERHMIEERLRVQPESYPPEPLIEKCRTYRWAKIVRNFKLIYYYAPSSDIVRITDIWDMRMNPETLKKRIK